MNTSAIIIYSLGTFYFGLITATFVKNIGYYWNRWGAFFGLILCIEAFVILPLIAAMIADENNHFLSAAMLAGFIIGMIKKKIR